MNFKETLRSAIINDENDLDIYSLGAENWPKDDEGEEQDLENWEIISITDDKMVMCCGGDWQDPMTFSIVLIDGKLTVTDIKKGEFEDGMGSDEILRNL